MAKKYSQDDFDSTKLQVVKSLTGDDFVKYKTTNYAKFGYRILVNSFRENIPFLNLEIVEN